MPLGGPKGQRAYLIHLCIPSAQHWAGLQWVLLANWRVFLHRTAGEHRKDVALLIYGLP